LQIAQNNLAPNNNIQAAHPNDSNTEQFNDQEQAVKEESELSAPLPTPGYFKNVSDRVLKAKVKLVESQYDLEAWNVLIKDAQVSRFEY